MSADFAKILDVDGEQFLVFVEPDTEYEEDGRLLIHQCFNVGDGLFVNLTAGGIDSSKTDEADLLAKVTVESARKMKADMEKLMGGDEE